MDLFLSSGYASSDSEACGFDAKQKVDIKGQGQAVRKEVYGEVKKEPKQRVSVTNDCCVEDEQIESQQHQRRKTPVNKRRDRDGTLLFERTVPHKRGNWAGHIYAELDNSCGAASTLKRAACRHVQIFQNQLRETNVAENVAAPMHTVFSHLSSSAKKDVETKSGLDENGTKLHISLSKLFFLQQHSIPSFEGAFRKQVETFKLTVQHMLPLRVSFPLTYSHAQVLCNDEKTRSFLTLPVVAGERILIDLIQKAVDPALIQFRQMPYYDSPIVHMSIASVPGSHEIKPCATKTSDARRHCNLVQGTETPGKSMSEESDDESRGSENEDDAVVTITIAFIVCTLGGVKEIRIPFT
jgi:hypothetical protein